MPAISAPVSVAAKAPAPRRPWGRWLLAGLLGLVLAAWLGGTFLLDPWLRRTLEDKVSTASHGRYRLRVGQLHTSLWRRGVELRAMHLTTNPTAGPADSLPAAELALGRLRLRGLGLWALLRGQEVPVASVRLDSLAVVLGPLPAGAGPGEPLYARLPGAGLRLGYLTVRHLHGRYGPATRPQIRVAHADLTARDLRLSAAGAADSVRVGGAAALAGRAQGLAVRVPGHEMRLRRLRFSTKARQLVLNSLAVNPEQPISPQRSAALRLRLALPQLTLTGLDAAALSRSRFRADSLGLRRPGLACTLPTTPPPPLHELLAPYLRECRLNTLWVSGGQLRVAGLPQAPTVTQVQLAGHDLRVLPRTRVPRIYYATHWQLRTGPATLSLDAPYYHLSWDQLQADTRRQQLTLRRVLVLPTLSVVELARRKGHQAAHLTVKVPELRLAGLDFGAAANRHEVRAASLTVSQPQVSSQSDGRFAHNPNISFVTPEAFREVPFRFAVGRLRVVGATITSQYRAPREARPGIIQIKDFAGALRNVSNDPARMSARRPLTGTATALLQGQCRMRVQLRANMLDPAGRHTVSGTFGPAPLDLLNSMTIPTRGIRFRRGQIQHISFQMQLDQQAARGTMQARYADLNLQRLNRQNKPGLLHRLETTVINEVFIRDDNPRKPGQPLQPGNMHSGRERHYSVFTLWRQGLISGLLNSAGVPAPLAKKLSEAE
ncbi:hypothetical protein D0N36_16095 [Hymenobacter lapidiphilus]|uniref:hypothetical protein n=1 Tax=Hymenobacter sp. CCM 8763 TaxID=2303334 RepID=UPI000E345A20|nr:hypothetical protein [Hymenobacter sp. CCM 8763]RFP64051.1 hypothetical protein D0N36_16095 [Hymenobacter sp. CCM 8763]